MRPPSPPRRSLVGSLAHLTVLPALAYQLGLGRLLGHRLLLVKRPGPRGRRGQSVVLEVVSWDPVRREAVVIAGFRRAGIERIETLEDGPREVMIGDDRFDSRMRRIEGPEAFAIFSDFEHRNRLLMPLAKPVVSRLAGISYDGSSEARRRLLERMPLVGLRDEACGGP